MQLEYWYYYRDSNNIPLVTVYIVADLNTGDYARGITICGFNDNVNKAEGKFWARNYALEALETKEDGLPILREDVKLILDSIEDFPEEFYGYKAYYLPELTDRELKLSEKAKNKLNMFVEGDV
jgi:hypothetical protein